MKSRRTKEYLSPQLQQPCVCDSYAYVCGQTALIFDFSGYLSDSHHVDICHFESPPQTLDSGWAPMSCSVHLISSCESRYEELTTGGGQRTSQHLNLISICMSDAQNRTGGLKHDVGDHLHLSLRSPTRTSLRNISIKVPHQDRLPHPPCFLAFQFRRRLLILRAKTPLASPQNRPPCGSPYYR
jgi:hypothetical protein